MKKLMIAALAVASVGAAYASDACGYITPDTAWVYKWTFSGKTTVGKTLKAAKVVKGNACGYSGSSSAQTTVCGYAVRVPASLKIEGYTWVCKPGCGSDAFEQFAEQNEIFWQNKPFKASLSGGVATDISNIIGTKAKQFEAAGIAKFTAYALRATSLASLISLTTSARSPLVSSRSGARRRASGIAPLVRSSAVLRSRSASGTPSSSPRSPRSTST